MVCAQRITVPHKVFSLWRWFFCEFFFLGVDSLGCFMCSVVVANEVDESDDTSEEEGGKETLAMYFNLRNVHDIHLHETRLKLITKV